MAVAARGDTAIWCWFPVTLPSTAGLTAFPSSVTFERRRNAKQRRTKAAREPMPRLVLLLLALVAARASALLRLPRIITSGMVMQAERPTIYGWASSTAVAVRTSDGETTEANVHGGRFTVRLAARPATVVEGVNITITSGGESVVLRDVLFGDVWVVPCAAQCPARPPATCRAPILLPARVAGRCAQGKVTWSSPWQRPLTTRSVHTQLACK